MKAKRLVRIGLFAVATYIGGLIQVPFFPVPITMQGIFVNLSALTLAPLDALMAMVLNFLLKLFLNGPEILTKPSLGFLFGFGLAGFLGSLYFRKSKKRPKDMALTILVSSLAPYLLGLPIMVLILTKINGLNLSSLDIMKTGFLIFIPGDIAKAILSYLLGKRIKPFIDTDSWEN